MFVLICALVFIGALLYALAIPVGILIGFIYKEVQQRREGEQDLGTMDF